MQLTALMIALLEFIVIGALPKIFFRKDGRYNLMWLMTGAPYLVTAVALLATYLGHLACWIDLGSEASAIMQAAGALLCMIGFALMCVTINSHRVPLALWHQDNDAPQSIVTWGAYKHIRHPFYTSFLLALIGGVLIAPSYVTTLSLIYGIGIMTITAI